MSSHVVSPLLYRLSYLATLNKNRNLSAQGLAVLGITVLFGVLLPIDACASQGLYLTEQNAKVLFYGAILAQRPFVGNKRRISNLIA